MQTVEGPLARRAGDALTWKAVQLAASKGMFLVRTLILARLLAPDDFGLLAIASVAVGFLMRITELGMTQALVHQKDIDSAHYDTAWTVNMIRGTAVAGVLILTAPLVAQLFGDPRAVGILRFLALKPLIDGLASTRAAELARHLRYRSLAFISLPAVLVETVGSVALATTLGVWALVVGALAGAAAALVMSYVVAPHRPRLVFETETFRPLIQYGRWVFLTGLVAVCASSLTQIVISRRLGAVELGLYFLAAKLAFLPHEVARQVVGDVAFSLYARVQDDRLRVARAFRSVLLGTATLLLPVYALLIALAPWLVADILGPRWNGTEFLIQALALVGIVGLFGDTTGPMFRGLGHPNWVLGIEVWQSGMIVLLLWGLTSRYGVLGAPAAWLIAIGSSQILNAMLARRIASGLCANCFLPLLLVSIASVAGGLIVVASRQVISGAGALIVTAMAATCVTAVVLWFSDTRFGLGLRDDVSRAFPLAARGQAGIGNPLIASMTALRRRISMPGAAAPEQAALDFRASRDGGVHGARGRDGTES